MLIGSLKNLLTDVHEIEKAKNETQKEINITREKVKSTKIVKEKAPQKEKKKKEKTPPENVKESVNAPEFKVPAPLPAGWFFFYIVLSNVPFVKENSNKSIKSIEKSETTDDSINGKKRKLPQEEDDESSANKIQRSNEEFQIYLEINFFSW